MGKLMKKRFAVLVMLCIVIFPNAFVGAECGKSVECREIIELALKNYFGTNLVNGEQDAPVDWCYYGSWREVFLFLSQPQDTLDQVRKIMQKIGEKVIEVVNGRRREGKLLGEFEKMVLSKGLVVRMMVKGMILPSGSLAIYVTPRDYPG